LVPVRLCDNVDRHADLKRASELQRLEIASKRNAFAKLSQAFLVDCFDAEKNLSEAELLPEFKHLLVAEQDVAACFQIESLADSLSRDRLTDLKAMPFLNECDIINDENARLCDRSQVLDDAFRVEQPVAAAIEGPGAAERAVPRATARELDSRARVERADEIFAAVAQAVACRPDLFKMLDEARPRTLPVRSDGPRHFGDCATVAHDGFEQLDDARLALALEDTINRALAVFYNGISDK